jgi:hypothetical protein
MFQKAELGELQAQKALLVLQSKANRLALAAEWKEFRATQTWMPGTSQLLRRQPIWAAGMAALMGALTVNVLRKPDAVSGLFGQIGNVLSLAVAIWRMLRRKTSAK